MYGEVHSPYINHFEGSKYTDGNISVHIIFGNITDTEYWSHTCDKYSEINRAK